jgi:hypothetical protein
LYTLFGVRQSPARVVIDTGAACGIGKRKLNIRLKTFGLEESVELLIFCTIEVLCFIGADADPNRGRTRSAPTTIKAAKNTYDRGLLRKLLGFEGVGLIIIGCLLEGCFELSHVKRPGPLCPIKKE